MQQKKEKNSPAVRRSHRMFFALFIDFVLIFVTASFVANLYTFAYEEFTKFGGGLPTPTQLLVDTFGYDNFALMFSYSPFMLLLYAATSRDYREYRSEGEQAGFLTVPNVYKSMAIYTLLLLISLLLPFMSLCGPLDNTEENTRYFILAVDAALVAGIFFWTYLRTKKNTPAE